MAKKRKNTVDKHARRERESAHARGARTDQQRPSDPGFGTGPSALGEVKRSSEEARLEACFECGYTGGRHSSRCSRQVTE